MEEVNNLFDSPPPEKTRKSSAAIMIGLLLIGIVVGGTIGYAITYSDFNNKLNALESKLGLNDGTNPYSSTYLLNDNVSLSALYQDIKPSVVIIQDLVPQYTIFGARVHILQQGSGFITKFNNQLVILTNNHVVDGTINITVTFSDNTCYPATILGQDSKADLAVLSVPSIPSSAKPLTLINSDTLSVGDPVVAVGSPYGLSGTLTTGIISALGRTITVENDEPIVDMIQTSTPINSGNSGGPLINYAGQVVGITTAAVSNSEGLGFAIPSSTILRELDSLITYGYYDKHPSINAVGRDMNYPIAQAMGCSVTYGWLVEKVSTQNGLRGGNAMIPILNDNVNVGGDVIIAINNVRIANADDLFSYLERNTLPDQIIDFTIIRDGTKQTILVTIGKA